MGDYNNNNNNTIINSVIKGVARTSIYVAATRAISTNKFIRQSRVDDDDDDADHHKQQQQQQVLSNYFVDHFYVDDLDDSFLDKNVTVYDPYAYFFSTHPQSVELLINNLLTVATAEEEEEDNNKSLNESIRETVTNYNPLHSWRHLMSTNAMLRGAKRTKLIDQLVLDNVVNNNQNNQNNQNNNNEKIKQVVVLASGLDTRHLRLPFDSDTKVFEIDLEQVIAYKRLILDQVTSHYITKPISQSTNTLLAADLLDSKHWTSLLESNGFNRSIPTFWLAEGLVMYFTEQQVHQLLSTISDLSSPHSQLLLHTLHPKVEERLDNTDINNHNQDNNQNNNNNNIINKNEFKYSTTDPESLIMKYAKSFQPIKTYNYQDIDQMFIGQVSQDTPLETSQFTLSIKK
ncbi:hypothetical protein DFA_08744 [Cavenderia fasciculata]|uniref:S-adenosyl-L-methionine-dependent methyltransferase n=1 Tax=Cavenderia fasciculata TaxID=261658 RepID=F4Q3Y9_CACFS|nr:uncharacterized protein DFA_08744 [Cavenderia fasciculata]EGG17745.1 hypothetical protein DFA_08744 [Cavenderia fasciculata]|eukprot:XP_004356229.1 hypothetical protein DFA_08744 [Cavenderia fasciculata]